MALYRETNETITREITRYVRARSISIDNGLGLNPRIQFVEEQVRREDGEEISEGTIGTLFEQLTPENATVEFALLDRETGAPTGTATYEDLRTLLFSLYFHLATERDAAGN